MTTWRDDPEVQKRVEALGSAYRLGKEVLRSMMATAVAADRRCLAREIENLPAPDEDGIYVWALDVVALLEQEDKP